MKVEYLILIILCFVFYQKSVKEDIKLRKNKDFINQNLKIGSNIITKSGIIGEVTNIDGQVVTILSGDYNSISKLKIQKFEIKDIIS